MIFLDHLLLSIFLDADEQTIKKKNTLKMKEEGGKCDG